MKRALATVANRRRSASSLNQSPSCRDDILSQDRRYMCRPVANIRSPICCNLYHSYGSPEKPFVRDFLSLCTNLSLSVAGEYYPTTTFYIVFVSV